MKSWVFVFVVSRARNYKRAHHGCKNSILKVCWWEEWWWWVGQVRCLCVLVRVSFCVNWLLLACFWHSVITVTLHERRDSGERALTADWPQMLFIWLISPQTMIPSLNCSGAYTGRRWEGASTGEMSHQGSQRGVKLCLTSAGSVAPLCPLCAPGKMI